MALPSWWDRVKRVMDQHGVPVKVWAPIAYQESTFNPNASFVQGLDDSWGLFAENRKGQAKGYAPTYLQDPVNNAMLAAPWLRHGIDVCGPDDIQCIALHSGHPSQTGSAPGSPLPGRIAASYNAIKGATDDESVYTSLMAGQTAGGDDSSGSSGGSDLGSLLGGIFRGLFGPSGGVIAPAPGGTTAPGTVDYFVENYSSIVFGILGVGSVTWGIMAAAITSPPGQAAVAAAKASGIAPVQIGAGVAQAVGGAPAAAGRTVGGVVRSDSRRTAQDRAPRLKRLAAARAARRAP